jgi:hypothetical protein
MPTVSDHYPVEIEPITILQNRWYNSLATHLNLDRSLFQISYPLAPIIHSTRELWAIQNVVPPLSLTFNSSAYPTRVFSDEYAAVVSQLQFPLSKFRENIGEDTYQRWMTYLDKITPPPPDHQLPILFRRWSLLSAPSAMSVGVSDLSQMVLISRALDSFRPYRGPNAKMIDFREDRDQIVSTLNNSTGAVFIFDSSVTDDNVKDTWTKGNNNGLLGLWNGNDSKSSLSRQFALGHNRVSVTFKSYAVCISVPGSWYNSSLLNTAYVNQTNPPWPVNPNPNWDDIFGQDGTMRRLIISLVMADEMRATVTSDCSFCKTDQEMIQRNASYGLWPFYIPSNNETVTNMVTFDNGKEMKIDTVVQAGNPIVIGNNILSIAQYLGHAMP